jgi:hypothetical protein
VSKKESGFFVARVTERLEESITKDLRLSLFVTLKRLGVFHKALNVLYGLAHPLVNGVC